MSANQRVTLPRTHRSGLGIGAALVLGSCLGAAGCARAPAAPQAAPPVSVTVSHPVERDVTDYAVFRARVAAVYTVEIRSRVTGHLDKVYFQDGAEVHKDDLLFE